MKKLLIGFSLGFLGISVVIASDTNFNVTDSLVSFNTTSNVTSNSPGTFGTDDFVFGSDQLNDDGDASHDSRVLFDKSASAFRAGLVTSTEWDALNRGLYSFASGLDTTASGNYSFATGRSTTASGDYSVATGWNSVSSSNFTVAMGFNVTADTTGATAFGNGSTASGAYSFASGDNVTTSADNAFASGLNTIASGSNSLALGVSSTAESYAETVVGSHNTDYTPASSSSWNAADRAFVVGNGASSGARSDAMVVLKNGNTGIGSSAPGVKLEINGAVGYTSIPTITYSSGTTTADWSTANTQTMTFGAGNIATLAFTDPTAVGQTIKLKMIQDGTGSRVVTAWDADIQWVGGGTAPTLSTAASAEDWITCIFTNTGAGNRYDCAASLDFQ